MKTRQWLLIWSCLFVVLANHRVVVCSECEYEWAAGFGAPYVGGVVYALTAFDDGNGPAVYVAGDFTTVGGSVSATRIAKWDGATWSPLGDGLDGPAYALTVFDDGAGPALYAGGVFLTAGGASASYVARWDGIAWSSLGTGTNGPVYALAMYDDGSGPALYAGGDFTVSGGVSTKRVAKWDGATWSALGPGTNNEVEALAVFDDGSGPALYVGGFFSMAGGVSASRIAKWDGSTWSGLDAGIDGPVFAISVYDDGNGAALYAGGSFTTAGGVSARRVAKWDGVSWSNLAGGLNGSVYALSAFDDGSGSRLVAAGEFTDAGNRIASWNGTSWSSLETGANSTIFAMTVLDDGGIDARLFAGGLFSSSGGIPAGYIAKWNGEFWSGLGNGTGTIATLLVHDDGAGPALFAGGEYIAGSPLNPSSIGKWDGVRWSRLGGGINGAVNALAVFHGDGDSGPTLYIAGQFSVPVEGGTPLVNSAKWNGSTWSAHGGTNAPIYALAVFQNYLYAGGAFTGFPASGRITVSQGGGWSQSVGGGMNDVVLALKVFDDGLGPALYAGGNFTIAGSVIALHIAKWDGSQWSPLGSGLNGSVSALAVFDDGGGPALFAGGYFGLGASYGIAKWNGVTWSPLGTGTQRVSALAVFDEGGGPELYCGVSLSLAGGISVRGIARWNGITWSPLGAGIQNDDGSPGYVGAIAEFDDGSGLALFAGGSFTRAGGIPSSAIAKWSVAGPGPTIVQPPTQQAAMVGQSASFSVMAMGKGALSYQWRIEGTDLTDGGSVFGATDDTLTIDPVSLSDAGHYDVVVHDDCGSVTSPAAMLMLGCSTVAECQDQNVCTLDACTVGACSNSPILYANTNGDAFVNGDDVLCLLDTTGGNPASAICQGSSFEERDIAPCPSVGDPTRMGDGFINADDILAVLDRFAGIVQNPACDCVAIP